MLRTRHYPRNRKYHPHPCTPVRAPIEELIRRNKNNVRKEASSLSLKKVAALENDIGASVPRAVAEIKARQESSVAHRGEVLMPARRAGARKRARKIKESLDSSEGPFLRDH